MVNKDKEYEGRSVVVTHPLMAILGRMMAAKVKAGGQIGFHVEVMEHRGDPAVKIEGAGDAIENAFVILQLLEAQPEVKRAFNLMRKIKLDPEGIGKDLKNADDQLRELMDDLNKT